MAPPPVSNMRVEGPCTPDGHCISSGNFPRDYDDAEECEITGVPASPIRVEAFNTENDHDYMTIDGVRCVRAHSS